MTTLEAAETDIDYFVQTLYIVNELNNCKYKLSCVHWLIMQIISLLIKHKYIIETYTGHLSYANFTPVIDKLLLVQINTIFF